MGALILETDIGERLPGVIAGSLYFCFNINTHISLGTPS
jgi:hypothetical protein